VQAGRACAAHVGEQIIDEQRVRWRNLQHLKHALEHRLDHAADQGLLTLQAGPDVLRFVPSLNITDEEVAEGLKRLRAAIAAFIAAR